MNYKIEIRGRFSADTEATDAKTALFLVDCAIERPDVALIRVISPNGARLVVAYESTGWVRSGKVV